MIQPASPHIHQSGYSATFELARYAWMRACVRASCCPQQENKHLRKDCRIKNHCSLFAGQDEFRNEILSCGFVLVSEPPLPELSENYIMVFRPCTEAELAELMAASVGAGWASSSVPVV